MSSEPDEAADLVTEARTLAEELVEGLTWKESDYGGYWVADRRKAASLKAVVATALHFLETNAGSSSQHYRSAVDQFESKGENQSMESGAHAVGDVLVEWAKRIENGQLKPVSDVGLGIRGIVSTDLMDQVRALNFDGKVSPIAPIVLAGAALEVALRGAVEELGLDMAEKPSITAYGRLLRKEEVIDKQSMKDLEQMSGVRNSAAHGEQADLSRERAGLMEQQVNLFLARLNTDLRLNEEG